MSDFRSAIIKPSRVISYVLIIALVAIMTSCGDDRHPYARYEPEMKSDDIDPGAVYAVVEAPAGTTQPQSLDTAAGKILPANDNHVDFLPYPGNFGFISSTLNPSTGRPLETLIMMSALETGSVIEVIPVATLQLSRSDILREITIAVPADTALQSIHVEKFVDFITEYEAARHILQEWFVNSEGFHAFDLEGWQDEVYTSGLIQKLRIPPE